MSAGRNQPCPCGSGRKYKLCCLPAVEQAERDAAAAEDRALDEWLQEDFRLGHQLR